MIQANAYQAEAACKYSLDGQEGPGIHILSSAEQYADRG